MNKDNLQPKMIMDFNTEDTIYIKQEISKGHSQLFLCQFIEYKGSRVYGKAISTEVNSSVYAREIVTGLTVSADYRKCALYGKNPVTDHTSYHWFDNSGYAIYPHQYDLENNNAKIINKHPSFGMVGITRRTSNQGVSLFGSSIQHKETISLTIKKADVERKYNREWFYGNEQLIEIELSSSQFAEMITSPNCGDGVPCTISSIGLNKMPYPPYESKRDLFTKEFDSKMKNISAELKGKMDSIFDILENKKTIGKGDRDLIKKSLDRVLQDIGKNVPFVANQFSEQMDKTVTEAKSEIESFVNRRLTEAGKKVLLGEDGSSDKMIHE